MSTCFHFLHSVERIEAGGNLSYFVVENEDISNGRKTISLLATGNGQFGGIGNSQWAHAGTLSEFLNSSKDLTHTACYSGTNKSEDY